MMAPVIGILGPTRKTTLHSQLPGAHVESEASDENEVTLALYLSLYFFSLTSTENISSLSCTRFKSCLFRHLKYRIIFFYNEITLVLQTALAIFSHKTLQLLSYPNHDLIRFLQSVKMLTA